MKNSIKMIIIMMMVGIQANRLMAQNQNIKAGVYLPHRITNRVS